MFRKEIILSSCTLFLFLSSSCRREDGCYSKALADRKTHCGSEVIEVCACNGRTYNNACEAQKDGNLSYTYGPCQ